MDCAVDAALMAFSQARPPGIYKKDYIEELLRRYGDEDESFPPPDLPEWCFEIDYDDDEDKVSPSEQYNHSDKLKRERDTTEDTESSSNYENESSSSKPPPSKRSKRNEFVNVNATFMSGVPGVSLVTDQPRLKSLQERVQMMCEWNSRGFPGCQPVSMDKDNLNLLHTKPYRVSWKADGSRYMMLVLKEKEVYFFDRDHSCFQVQNMKFLQKKDLTKHITETLLDGVSSYLLLF